MINWFDMPAEGLSNGGLFEVKELEVTENGTYETKGEMYNKVTVNVEGGGGSSDFSTAEVTIVAESEYVDGLTINILTNSGLEISNSPDVGTFQTVLYKGVGNAYLFENIYPNIVVTGNAVYDSMIGKITITGDCTITIS